MFLVVQSQLIPLFQCTPKELTSEAGLVIPVRLQIGLYRFDELSGVFSMELHEWESSFQSSRQRVYDLPPDEAEKDPDE